MNAADLLARYAARRDAEAFAELVRDYQSMVVATCRRRLAAPGDVDDAVQETFLKLARNAGTLRANVAAWLHRCATNVAVDLNRRGESRRRHESAAAVADLASDASRELAELREHLDAAIDRLDEPQRELILQRFFVGRSQADLAAAASVSPSAMSQRVDRAIAALRQHLAASGAVAASAALVDALSAERASAQATPALTAKLNAIGLSGAPAAATATVGIVWSAIGAACLLAIAGAALWWGTLPTTSIVAATTAAPTTQAGAGLTVRPDANASDSATPDWRGPATPGGVLSGRITDAAGKPIADATVGLDNVRGPGVTTDADGVYRFDTIPRDGTYRLSVEARGFVPVEGNFVDRDTLRLSSNAQAVRNVVLQRAHSVTVLVDDAAGVPIEDARVSFAPVTNGTDPFGRRAFERSASHKRGETEVVVALPVGTTPYAIMATAKDHAPAFAIVTPTTADASNVTITLDAGLSVEGTATCSDGKPAAGWQIAAKPVGWPSPGSYPIPFATIDDAGHFTLPHVPRGRHELTIEVPNGEMWTGSSIGTFDLTGAPLAVAVPMKSPGSLATIRGKLNWVGDATDASVGYGMRIEATGRVGRHSYSTMLRTEPKRRPASFEIANVEPDEYTIRFASTTVEPVTLEHVKIPGDVPDVTLRAIRKSRLGGTVVDEQTGKAVANFAFRVRKVRTLGDGPNYGQSGDWVQVADADGAFVADLVGPGEYQVQVSAGGYAWRWSGVAKVETPGAIATTQVKLAHGGGLRGLVLAPDGKPVGGAKVIPFSMAQSADVQWYGTTARFDGEAGAVVTDADGRYELQHLSVGDETLKVVHPDFAPLVMPPARIVAGETVDASTATLRVGGSVEGVVYDGDGRPESNVGIAFRDNRYYGDRESTLLASTTTDAAGRYRVAHLVAGTVYGNLNMRGQQRTGVVKRVAYAADGRTATLDFGGPAKLTGRLVDGGGRPRTGDVALEFSTGQPTFGATRATVRPDADGRFTIRGMPAGRFMLYAGNARGGGVDVPLRDVAVTGESTQDLGDVVDDRGRVTVLVDAEDPADAPAAVVLTTDPSTIGYDFGLGRFRQQGDRWVCDDVPAGRSIVAAHGADYAAVGAAKIERRAGDPEKQVTISLRRRTATLRYVPSTQPTRTFARLIDAAGTERIGLGGDQPATIRVPPGTFRVTAGNTRRPRADVAPIVVAAGETADVTLPPEGAPVTTEVFVFAADGSLCTDARVTLVDAGRNAIAPVPCVGFEYALFGVTPGRYLARIERAGAATFERPIDVGWPPHAAWTSPVTCDVVLPD